MIMNKTKTANQIEADCHISVSVLPSVDSFMIKNTSRIKVKSMSFSKEFFI